jgi:hypothetical protein
LQKQHLKVSFFLDKVNHQKCREELMQKNPVLSKVARYVACRTQARWLAVMSANNGITFLVLV